MTSASDHEVDAIESEGTVSVEGQWTKDVFIPFPEKAFGDVIISTNVATSWSIFLQPIFSPFLKSLIKSRLFRDSRRGLIITHTGCSNTETTCL